MAILSVNTLTVDIVKFDEWQIVCCVIIAIIIIVIVVLSLLVIEEILVIETVLPVPESQKQGV